MLVKKALVSALILGSIVACFALKPDAAKAAVWETTAQWDDAAEASYRLWVANNWNKDFFLQEGPMKGAVMDCADTVYSMRVLYAAQAGLPFVMKDPTSRKARLISNDMTRWDNKPPEERLRAFLTLIYQVGSTASMPADTYPTAITPATLGSGSIILTDPENHHSWTIQSFRQTGTPYLLSTSRPAHTVLTPRETFPSFGFVFPQGLYPETNAGFRNFRQPEFVGKPVAEVPGFSLDQYSLPANSFMKSVQKRMQHVEETPQQHILRLYRDACRGVQERVQIVRDGLRQNKTLGATCMTQKTYDDYSTPSRDRRIKDSMVELKAVYLEAVRIPNGLSEAVKKQIGDIIVGKSDPVNQCIIDLGGGKKLTLAEIYLLSVNDKLSSNPQDTLEMRWGLQSGPSEKAKACPVY